MKNKMNLILLILSFVSLTSCLQTQGYQDLKAENNDLRETLEFGTKHYLECDYEKQKVWEELQRVTKERDSFYLLHIK